MMTFVDVDAGPEGRILFKIFQKLLVLSATHPQCYQHITCIMHLVLSCKRHAVCQSIVPFMNIGRHIEYNKLEE